MASVKGKGHEDEEKEIIKSPTDALLGSAGGGDPEVIRFFLFLIFYLFILLILSNFFTPLIAFILWIATGFGIYKVAENYGEEVPWIKQVMENIQNIGFTSTSPDTAPEAVEAGVDEPEEEKAADLDNYAEKFDEWRLAKDAVSAPFVSAGERISTFSFNSDGLYKFRLWVFVLLVPLLWYIIITGILPIIFGIWYSILGFSNRNFDDDAFVLGSISALFLSYFLLIRLYSHCTNKRKIPLNTGIMSDYDPYVVSHLFQNPKGKSTFSITSKALLLDFIGGWFIVIFLTVVSDESPLELVASISVSKYFSLVTTLILLAVAVPIIEELLFRGLILDSLSESYGSWASIFISSVIFAILHIHPLSILNAFWGGMIYGYVRMRTNSLWPSIFLHSMWNGHIVLLLFFYL
jgi:membrane protease YdiL (CAAX protease family)